jgi:O-antigen/teichoic acid export membrane protein
MTTVPATQPLVYETPALEPRKLSRRLGKDVWALGDQVLISGTNFVTMILAARGLHPAAFGAFTLVYSALLFANIFQSTLVTQAHNVLGTARSGADYVRYTTSTAVSQLMIILAEVAIAASVAILAWKQGWEAAPLLIALVPAIVGYQIQEFLRRVLYTEGRFAAAFCIDLLSYGAQATLLATLWLLAEDELSGARILYIIATTTTLSAVVGFWLIRRSLAWSWTWDALKENWRFGRWLAGADILQWCSSINVYLYLAAGLLGTTASGELKAAQVLFGPARIFAFQLVNVLPMKFSRTLAAGGNAALHRRVKGVYAWFAPLSGGYCLLVAVFAAPLLRLIYGPDYTGSAAILVLFSACAFVNYMELVVSAAMTAKRQTHWAFVGYVCSAGLALLLAWPLLNAMGIKGAVIGMIVTSVVVVAVFWQAYVRNVLCAAEEKLVDRGVELKTQEAVH